MQFLSMNNRLFDREVVHDSINQKGFARIRGVLTSGECKSLSSLYNSAGLFRSVISMERYRFGKGEYKYFNYPLPRLIQVLREDFYTDLVKLANGWNQLLGIGNAYPENHPSLLAICKENGQERPTPL